MLTLFAYRLPRRVLDLFIERSDRLARRGHLVFVMSFAAIALAVVGIGAPFVPLGSWAREVDEDWLSLLTGLILAPLLETLLMQLGPALMTRALGGSDRLILFTASIPFALLHALISIRTAAATMILGFLLALTFVVWSRRSLNEAYWTMVGVHALYNGVLFAIMAVTGSFHLFGG